MELAIKPVIIGSARLYLGDCRAIMPLLQPMDSLLADPPYGIDGGNGGDSRRKNKGDYGGEWTDDEDYIERTCVPAIVDALALVKRGAITPGVRCAHLYPRAADMGCFWSPASMTHGPWGFRNFQPILYYGKDHRAGKGSLPTGRPLTEAAESNGHPCPKPIGAWKWLLDKVSQPGETVFDPFMGSGTTGVAAAQLGRDFVGIELEAKFFDIACRRIEDAHRQGDIFSPPAPKLKPARLFDA